MPRVKDEYRTITDEELLALGNKIVPTSMIPTIWQKQTGHTYTRTAPLKAKQQGRIKPMGQNRSVLYWWRDEIERQAPVGQGKRGKPTTKHDENKD